MYDIDSPIFTLHETVVTDVIVVMDEIAKPRR